jgi:hypothetical protein
MRITPDGKHSVFDHSREKSDIVLIDLPRPHRYRPRFTLTLTIARRGSMKTVD